MKAKIKYIVESTELSAAGLAHMVKTNRLNFVGKEDEKLLFKRDFLAISATPKISDESMEIVIADLEKIKNEFERLKIMTDEIEFKKTTLLDRVISSIKETNVIPNSIELETRQYRLMEIPA